MPIVRGATACATAEADGQVMEWSPPKMIGTAPLAATSATLLEDHRVAALQPGGHDVGVAGIDDVEVRPTVSTSSWSECSPCV